MADRVHDQPPLRTGTFVWQRDTFVCEQCGQRFTIDRTFTEAEREAEYQRTFTDAERREPRAEVCDDCFVELTARIRRR